MKKKFVLVAVFGTLVIVAVALVLTASANSRSAAAKLEDLRTEARKLGMPTTMKEVPIGKGPTPASNAAILIKEASTKFGKDDEAAVALLIEAGFKPDCDFGFDPMDSAQEIKALDLDKGIALLLDRAETGFKDGSLAEAQRYLRAALATARVLTFVPTPEAFTESLRLERAVFQRLGRLMVERPDDGVLMTVVQAATLDPRSHQSLTYSLRGFYASGNEIGQNREIDGDQSVSWLWTRGDFPTDPWGRDAVEARHLEGAIALHKKLAGARSWPDAVMATRSAVEEWQKDTRASSYSLKATAPSIADLPTAAAENEAARRVLFVSAAAFRSRIRTRAFPARSPVLGEMSFDVFTGTPMSYFNPGTGFYVYSVGSDGLDDGGPSEHGLTFEGDVSFYFAGPRSPAP